MRIHLPFFVIVLLLWSCSPSKQIEKRYTQDDKTVFDLIERLKKNANDIEAARLLPEAYRQAAELRKNINQGTYNNMSEGDRWIEISKQLMVAEEMYNQIRSNPSVSKVIPDPWDPALKIQEAKQKAADEYYNQGLQYMTFNNRPYAQKAYDMFEKANKAYPNYKDVRTRMEEAKELATIKVLIQAVNYDNFGWSHWGFSNDYLQYKIVRDLNHSSYRDVRFFSETDARVQNIRPDKIVTLNFTNFFIGQVYSDNYTATRSKQIKIGETKSNPPQPVYETVTATVYVTRRVLQSNASLECRIYDWATGNNILYDRFPDTYVWKHETARYTGDSRALQASDWIMINNSGNYMPPSRNEMAQQLVDNCYNRLLSRIRSGVEF